MKRKGIDPITGTVLIIALTLIAAVAIGGFVFGIFGSSSNSAQVAVTSLSCAKVNSTIDCYFQLTNTGTAPTQMLGAQIQYGNMHLQGSCPSGYVTILASKAVSFECLFPITNFAIQNTLDKFPEIYGQITLTNGAILIFAGQVG